MGFSDRLPPALRGIVFMLASTLAFALLWVFIRLAAETMPVVLLVFWRTLFGLVFMAPMLAREGRGLFATRRHGLHGLRAATGALAMYATFYAVSHAPLADVTAISYASPLFAALLAALFLGETMRMRRLSALALGFFGMLMVVRPGMAELDDGRMAAIAGALLVAGSLVAIKLLSRTERPETTVAWSYILILPLNLAVALLFWRWPDARELLLLAIVGVLANIGQMALTRAFSAAEATAVLPFDFVRLVLAALFGVTIFGEDLAWQTVAGAGIILVSSVYLAHREARLALAAPPPPPGPGAH